MRILVSTYLFVLFTGPLGAACSGGDPADDPDAAVTDAVPDIDAFTGFTLTLTKTGMGTLTVEPPGMPCGDDCLRYEGETEIAITADPDPGHGVVWTGACQDTEERQPCRFLLSADEQVDVEFECSDLLVDPLGGDDNGPGTCAVPLKTLGRAFEVAQPGYVIRALPGVYDEANGETFPLTVPEGVSLLGNESGKGINTTIRHNAGDLIYLSSDSVLAGFTVTEGRRNIVVSGEMRMPVRNVTIRNNTVTNGTNSMSQGAGIWFNGPGEGHRVTDNVVFGNDRGVAHIGMLPGVAYERNAISYNEIGVEINTDGADLGGGAQGSEGGNDITCNMKNDIFMFLFQDITLFAQRNAFDHDPPTTGADDMGTDLYVSLFGTIDTAESGVVGNPCE